VILSAGAGAGAYFATRSSSQAPTHARYARLFAAATVGKTRIDQLSDWPSTPYQDFHDMLGRRCLEWFDRGFGASKIGGILYDLCFDQHGVLVAKLIP